MGRLVFMGSPDFALPSLQALLAAGHEIALVLSRPDQPSGRGRRPKPTAVAAFAMAQGLPLARPARLKDPDLAARLRGLAPDLFVVVAYRILPAALLGVPRLGSVNLHGSLLPAYRGAAPVERALMDGVARTGLTTFLLAEGVDTGRILDTLEVEVGPEETAGELKARLREAGAPLLARSVADLLAGRASPREQPPGEYPAAPKLGATDRILDFARPAAHLHNQVRALSPEPGALALFRGRPLQVLRTRPGAPAGQMPSGPHGRLRAERGRLFVAAGDGELEILELMPAGRRRLPAQAWLAGARLGADEGLAAPAAELGDRP